VRTATTPVRAFGVTLDPLAGSLVLDLQVPLAIVLLLARLGLLVVLLLLCKDLLLLFLADPILRGGTMGQPQQEHGKKEIAKELEHGCKVNTGHPQLP
jgi:hypothetical protein